MDNSLIGVAIACAGLAMIMFVAFLTEVKHKWQIRDNSQRLQDAVVECRRIALSNSVTNYKTTQDMQSILEATDPKNFMPDDK